MKKRILTLFLTLVLAFTLVACKGDKSLTKDKKKTVTLWIGGSENVKNAWIALSNEFNKNSQYKDKYELKIEHVASGTGATTVMDRLIAAYKANEKDTTYDIVELSSQEYTTYINEAGKDIFLDIDKSKIPNFKDIQAKLSSGENQIVPFRGTTVVLAYNSEMVPNPPKTVQEMYKYIKDNPGKFAYCAPGTGGSGNSFLVTSVYNFLPKEAFTSTDEKWTSKWDKGFNLLKELHPYLYKSAGKVIYPHKNQGTLDLLINEQISMTPAWVDMILEQINQGTMPDKIKLTQITPGFTGGLVSLAIPSISKNSDGAYAVIDFVVSKEAQTILLDRMGAFPVIDINGLKSKNAEKLSSFKIEDFRTIDIGGLENTLIQKWNEEIAPLD